MRILIHTQYFPPEIGAPQNRLFDLACELSVLGHDISVLTAMPNYPTGKIFTDYHGVLRVEKIHSIKIIRTAILPSQSPSFIPRLLSYFSFVIMSFVVGLFIKKPDIIFTESPPLFLGISGWLLSRFKRAKWIFNVADLWPDSALELGIIQKSSMAYKISRALESFFYQNAWLVTGQSKTILEVIQKRFAGINSYHLSNGVRIDLYPKQHDRSNLNKKLTIMYAGLHGLAQGLDQIIYAAAMLDSSTYHFVLIGDGPTKVELSQLAQQLNVTNVEFHDPIAREGIPGRLATSDLLIVPLKVQLTGAVPSKLYEAMAACKPIILIAQSEAADIVRQANCGIVVNPGDVEGLVAAINTLKENALLRFTFGKNGRDFVERNFDRAAIALEFSKFLNAQLSSEINRR